MKISFKQTGILMSGTLIFSACAGQPDRVSEKEVSKYETKYLQEYEKIKNNYTDNSIVKWIQASNKTKPCKVFVGTSKKNDITTDSEFKIFWDGECKNGYAYGLGREFERGTLISSDSIAIYSGKKEEPKYYVYKYNLDNILLEGDLKNNYFVKTIIKDENLDFDISYEYGFFGSKSKPYLIAYSSPFKDYIVYIKGYPNFGYRITDFTNDEFDERKHEFSVLDFQSNKVNGFGFQLNKNHIRYSGEKSNGQLVRSVYLPRTYINKADNILSEVQNAGQKALEAQKQAWVVKKQYKKRICKDSVKVNFIDDDEYKSICNEDKYFARLKEKVSKKLAKINLQKDKKRQQRQQQQLITIRQREANARARAAAAAENANLIQSMQNADQNFQMNMLNNNLFMMRMGQ
jgi:hypothetical protein